ncbi:MAG TPA: nuclear transport factor 2 family protein [Candidatus Elarobacter sp.]
METLVHRYIQSWNELDPVRRRAAIEEVYTADAVYVDPLAEATGWDQIDAMVAAAQKQLAGFAISLAGPVDEHHQIARFQWQAGSPGLSEPLVVGFDVAEAQDGKLTRLSCFFDKVPAQV